MSEESYDKRKFKEMEDYIEDKRKVGKVPLFIIGAGVSKGKVPLMNDIFEHFANINISKISENEIKNIKTYAQILYQNKKYQTIATSAHLFNLLQNSTNENIRNLWKQFTRKFLMGEIGKSKERSLTPLWGLEPTDFHLYIAEQVVREFLPAFCISLNYDGLTAKAIATTARRKIDPHFNPKELDKLYPCRILSTPEEIEDFWSSNLVSNRLHVYPLIKLKGDIFYASCSNERCKYHAYSIPSYIFLHEKKMQPLQMDNHDTDRNNLSQLSLPIVFINKDVDTLFPCPECGSEMKFWIDFPGYREKKFHTQELIEKIYTY